MAPKAKPAAKAAAAKAEPDRKSVRTPSLSGPAGKRQSSTVLRSSGAAILAPSSQAKAAPASPAAKAAASSSSAPKAAAATSAAPKAAAADAEPRAATPAGESAAAGAAAASSTAPPSQCSGCGAAFKAGQALYSCKQEGNFFCQDCAEKSIAWQPEKCDVCGERFASGMSVFKSGEDGGYACAKCAALSAAKINSQLPSKCTECSATFAEGSKYFEGASEGEYLCMACAEKKFSEKTRECSRCKTSLLGGQKAFKAPDGSGNAVCEKCLEAAIPKCAACGEPASGSVAKLGDKVYHTACVKCFMCEKSIDGPCAQSSRGLVCPTCKESVSAQMQQLQKILEAGDVLGAARLAEKLKATGLLPPSMKLPELKCVMCSVAIEGDCDQTANGLICLKCGEHVAEQVQKMKEMFDGGNPMGAAMLGKKLEQQGVTPPTIEMLKYREPSLLRSAKYEKDEAGGEKGSAAGA